MSFENLQNSSIETKVTTNTSSHILPAAEYDIDLRLEDCQKLADLFIRRRKAPRFSLYTALGDAYFWWTQCNHVVGRFDACLAKAGVQKKNLDRKFSSLIRLVFHHSPESEMADEARLELEAVIRFAIVLDAVHRHFEGTPEFSLDVACFIEEEGVQELIDAQLAFEAGSSKYKGDDEQI